MKMRPKTDFVVVRQKFIDLHNWLHCALNGELTLTAIKPMSSHPKILLNGSTCDINPFIQLETTRNSPEKMLFKRAEKVSPEVVCYSLPALNCTVTPTSLIGPL